MERLVINGGKALKGSVEINGAKNAAVAILPATVLASNGKCIIDNIPDIEDVHCLERILYMKHHIILFEHYRIFM